MGTCRIRVEPSGALNRMPPRDSRSELYTSSPVHVFVSGVGNILEGERDVALVGSTLRDAKVAESRRAGGGCLFGKAVSPETLLRLLERERSE
jgi:hypothetical protein